MAPYSVSRSEESSPFSLMAHICSACYNGYLMFTCGKQGISRLAHVINDIKYWDADEASGYKRF